MSNTQKVSATLKTAPTDYIEAGGVPLYANAYPRVCPMAETMRAMLLERFGEPLVLRHMQRPVPRSGEVLVKIFASGVNPLFIRKDERCEARLRPRRLDCRFLDLQMNCTRHALALHTTRAHGGNRFNGPPPARELRCAEAVAKRFFAAAAGQRKQT